MKAGLSGPAGHTLDVPRDAGTSSEGAEGSGPMPTAQTGLVH